MRFILLPALLVIAGLQAASAQDVRVLSAAAVRMPLVAAQSMSQAATGLGLQLDFGTAGGVRDKITAGTPADLVVLPPARLDQLVAEGLVVPEGRTSLGVVRLGIAVRSGTPKPAVATEADIRVVLAEASTIGFADPASGATTGLYFAKLFKQMGLDETLKPKVRLFADGTAAMEALARGEVAIAAGQISEIRPVPGVDLVGPFPETLQLRTVYAVGVAMKARAPQAARAIVAFLTSPRMAPAFTAAGFDLPRGRARRPMRQRSTLNRATPSPR